MKKLLFALIITMGFGYLSQVYSQNKKCGAMFVHQRNIAKDPSILQRQEQLENFTKVYVAQQNSSKFNKTQNVVTIPLVVHVVHAGESIGTGANISVNQIMSQIDILNDDFGLFNADSLPSSHPFWPYTADTEIEFCLATTDPDGNPTTGIERHDYGQPFYTLDYIDSIIKPQTIWDRD